MKTAAVLAVVALVAIGCGKPSEQSAPAVSSKPAVDSNVPVDLFGSSAISGKVLLKGAVPKPLAVKMNADPYCQATHETIVTSEDLLVNADGTLRNVFVYVKKGISGGYTTPKTPGALEQKGCTFLPHVQGLQTGQSLVIRNSDDTIHNIHAMGDVNPSFNIGQPLRGMESKKMFNLSEVMIRFKCDVHPWMNSFIGVLPHPFHSVTGDGGTFMLAKMPAGEYVVEAWHEKLGVQQQTVILSEAETKNIEFTFSN